jgi:hypothetical protein
MWVDLLLPTVANRWGSGELHKSHRPGRHVSQHKGMFQSDQFAATTAGNPRRGRLPASVGVRLWRAGPQSVLPEHRNAHHRTTVREQNQNANRWDRWARESSRPVGMRNRGAGSGGPAHRGWISCKTWYVNSGVWQPSIHCPSRSTHWQDDCV